MLPHSLLTRRPCLDIGLFQLVDIGRENFLLEVATRLPSTGVHGDGDGGNPAESAGVGMNVAGIPRGWI